MYRNFRSEHLIFNVYNLIKIAINKNKIQTQRRERERWGRRETETERISVYFTVNYSCDMVVPVLLVLNCKKGSKRGKGGMKRKIREAYLIYFCTIRVSLL